MEPNRNNPNQDGGNYSVDEMMARLKRNERQKRSTDPSRDGELVTREDGSQVVKVRRRKRRSQQPEKKKASSPRMKWAILGTIIGAFILLTSAVVFIIVKYNGRSFKEDTETTISSLSGAENTEITQLRVTPVSAKAAKAELSWDQHSFLHSASFTNINADIKATSFFSSDWIGEEVVASLGSIRIQSPTTTVETSDNSTISPYNFGAFRCNQLDLKFGPDQNAPAITDLQVSLRKQIGEKYQIVFNNGIMQLPHWPTLEISSGIMTINSGDSQVEARLEASNDHHGELSLKGRIYHSTTRPVVLDVKAKNYPIQDLLGTDLGRIIQGNIKSDMGSFTYDYNKDSTEALSFIMPFDSTDLRISELPLFNDLKDITRDTQYARPVLNNCRGTIIRNYDSVTLSNLRLTSSRILTITGNMSVNSQGNLSGTLKVGIPSRIFGKNTPPPSIFTDPHAGFIHATVTLSGSIHNPHDNLNEQLKQSGLVTPTRPSRAGTIPTMDEAERRAQEQEKEFRDLTR